ncbi:MAG: tetratricopeptide repeat protein [bacterium]|nr:tetratricopeptide repeat protein [bacterium]
MKCWPFTNVAQASPPAIRCLFGGRGYRALVFAAAAAVTALIPVSSAHGASGYLKPAVDEKILNKAEDRFNDGVELYQRQNYRAALRRFQAAETICPELFAAGYHAALAYKKMGDEKAAVEQLKKVIARFPENIIAYNDLGVIHAGKNIEEDTQLAMSQFETAIRNGENLLQGKEKTVPQVRVDLAMAYANAGGLHLASGRLVEAEKSFRKAVEHHPNGFFGHFGLGNVLLAMRNFAEAKTSYREAQQIEPKNTNVSVALAKCYLRQPDRNPRFTIAELRKVGETDRTAEYYDLFGDAYALLEEREEAVRNYTRSLGMPGHSSEVLYKLGAMYYNQKMYVESRKSLEEYVAQVKDGEKGTAALAHKLLGDIAKEQNDYRTAAANYKKAVSIANSYWSAYYGLGEACFHLKQYADARKHLHHVLSALPEKGTAEENELREKATELLKKMLSTE